MGKVVTKKNRKPALPKKLALEPHQVIIKPTVTEKAMYQSTELNQYTFKVNPSATKTDIKKAYGRTKDWKKAIVTLHPDDKIDFF